MTFKTLKENSINPLALGYLNIRFPFLFLSMKKKAMPLGCSPQNLRTINPQGISAAGPCGVETTPCPRALLPLPWGNYCGISSNYLCTPSNRSPPEFSSYSAFFNQYLASYEILLLTDLQITLSNCSNFNSAIVPPLWPAKSLIIVWQWRITYWPHVIICRKFLWVISTTYGSYLKGDNGKYCAE